MHHRLFWLCFALLMLLSNTAFATTYTYLRCYYRVDPLSRINKEVANVWALNPNATGEYRVTGLWWSKTLALGNMFYSNIPYQTLLDRCQDTLKRKNIKAPLAMFAAADHSKSYNYLVWNVDPKSNLKSEKINRIVSFGDSLSDTNNFFNGRGWLDSASKKAYYAGRFTNGNNWIDYLSGDLNVPVYNWAIAGAATYDYDIISKTTGQWSNYGAKINGVVSQVNSWISYMDTNFMGENEHSNRFYDPRDTLFTMLIGGNDLLTYGLKVDSMIPQEEKALTRLINYGAKNILLVNLPDISRTPLFSPNHLIRKLNLQDPKSDPKKIHEQVLSFNSELVKMVDRLKTKYGAKVNIHIFDTYSMLNDLLAHPEKYGITNTTDSCLEIGEETLDTYSNEGKFRPICLNAPKQADSFIYFDLMHPTTRTHQILAEKVFCFIYEKNRFGPVLQTKKEVDPRCKTPTL